MLRLKDIPLFLILAAIAALAMYVPALHGLTYQRFAEARAFFYAGTLGLFAVSIIAIAISNRPRRRQGGLSDLLGLFSAFAALPLFLALPFYEGLRTTSFVNAYFEMLSSLTTTGATLFDPDRLSDTMHLWRALVGWLGGVLMWVCAAAVLAPLSLGGFEVTASAEAGFGDLQAARPVERFDRTDANRRMARTLRALVPIYVGLTAVLWLCLLIAGDTPFVAIIHAMSTLATSGITSLDGLAAGQSGVVGELLIFLFLFFALSRLTFSSDTLASARQPLLQDPEFRVGLLLIFGVPLLLFLRHWVAAFEVDEVENFSAALWALWGAIFTVLSFLSTTGFESAGWESARDWSGLGTPGLILLGLSLIGGGVATTAGGVKLLRVYALYLNGLREMERLVHPSSIGSPKGQGRRIRRQGAFIAWIFFMLFALSLALITVILAAQGAGFEEAILLSIATLSTTGPLISAAAETPVTLIELGVGAKLTLSAAMVLGRLETLAIIALINPLLWRD
ncbi:MAG: potassium transporter TrkH [Rhodobacterales bacterium]|nr:MAG: potassium transporter TrkH [Rhodobacterales bacterium]